jgi:hypothetical protein
MKTHQGGCFCGAVRYEISTDPKSLVHCHCADCRRTSGAPSLAWVIIPAEGFSWLSGEPKSFASSPPVTRTFCGICGTTLTYFYEKSSNIDVTTASLDDPDSFAPIKEIWVEQRLGWDILDEELPHFARSSIGNQPIN